MTEEQDTIEWSIRAESAVGHQRTSGETGVEGDGLCRLEFTGGWVQGDKTLECLGLCKLGKVIN